ncbi:hypothetical protein DL89DRAFT_269579, partial [Linderina pennispora]
MRKRAGDQGSSPAPRLVKNPQTTQPRSPCQVITAYEAGSPSSSAKPALSWIPLDVYPDQ